jgi:nicotinate-nucleotide pyrophosphorylase
MTNVLTHHGILGMKWGVRRTPEQLERTKGSINSASKIVNEAKNINDSIKNIRSTPKIKDLDTMSDQELKEKVKRMNLEQQYSTLSNDQKTKGQKYVRSTLEIAGGALAITGSALSIALSIKQLKG